jgi:hypothetical protein
MWKRIQGHSEPKRALAFLDNLPAEISTDVRIRRAREITLEEIGENEAGRAVARRPD